MVIRKAELGDKEAIQSLMTKLNEYRADNLSPETKEFHARTKSYEPPTDNDFEKDIFLVALVEDEITGFIRGSVHERKNNVLHSLGFIEELFVLDVFRKKGIAKELFLELENEFRRRGCDHMTVHTDFENELSQSFYH